MIRDKQEKAEKQKPNKSSEANQQIVPAPPGSNPHLERFQQLLRNSQQPPKSDEQKRLEQNLAAALKEPLPYNISSPQLTLGPNVTNLSTELVEAGALPSPPLPTIEQIQSQRTKKEAEIEELLDKDYEVIAPEEKHKLESGLYIPGQTPAGPDWKSIEKTGRKKSSSIFSWSQ